MAEAKKVKVEAIAILNDPESNYQMCWGVRFEVKGDKLLAELDASQADEMIKAGRAKKAS